jgi:hypothetical protein
LAPIAASTAPGWFFLKQCDDRHARLAMALLDRDELRRFRHAAADIGAEDQDREAQQERQPPAPGEENVLGHQ